MLRAIEASDGTKTAQPENSKGLHRCRPLIVWLRESALFPEAIQDPISLRPFRPSDATTAR
jgi:hypothetical protein